MENKEIWKKVEGWENYYMVSNLGNVKSIRTTYNMKPRTTHFGYKEVGFYKESKRYSVSVHRLVAKAFIPNPKNKDQVNHIDGNKTNNNIDNLEWVTRKENMAHAEKIGLIKYGRGNNAPYRKLSEEDVRAIKVLISQRFQNKHIASLFNVTPTAISDIKRGKCWSWLKINLLTNTTNKSEG